MEGRLLARARAKQEAMRTANRAEEDRRAAEAARVCPEIGEIGRAMRGHMRELVGRVLGRPGRSAEELEAENLAMQARRRELLVANGFAPDYLDPIFNCPLCRDTGWRGETMCQCMLRLYKQEQTEELAPLLRRSPLLLRSLRLRRRLPARQHRLILLRLQNRRSRLTSSLMLRTSSYRQVPKWYLISMLSSWRTENTSLLTLPSIRSFTLTALSKTPRALWCLTSRSR